MSFACIDKEGHKGHTHHVWVRQTKRITSWMIRIFFACTVAFSIPIGQLLSVDAFLKGSLMGIGPCVLTKVFCAPFMGNAKFVIGWAMVGRAEFAYLIAQMAAAANMIDEATFSICIWALLYATIFAPFIFRTVLNRYIIREGIEVGPAVYEDSDRGEEAEFDDIGHAESGHSHHQSQTKNKLDYDGGPLESNTFGKSFSDLDKIDLEDVDSKDRGRYQRERSGDFWEDPKKKSVAFAPDQDTGEPQTARRFGMGRAPARSVAENPNGFLCCLFFKKIVLN